MRKVGDTFSCNWLFEMIIERENVLVHVADWRLHIKVRVSDVTPHAQEPWRIEQLFFKFDGFHRGTFQRSSHEVLVGEGEMKALGLEWLWKMAVEEIATDAVVSMIDSAYRGEA